MTTTDDVPDTNPDIDSVPGTYGPEQGRCASCAGAHSIQRCPEIRARLFGISLELRRRISIDAAARVDKIPF